MTVFGIRDRLSRPFLVPHAFFSSMRVLAPFHIDWSPFLKLPVVPFDFGGTVPSTQIAATHAMSDGYDKNCHLRQNFWWTIRSIGASAALTCDSWPKASGTQAEGDHAQDRR